MTSEQQWKGYYW